MHNLTIIEHPVILDKMTKLRSDKTNTKEFRELVTEITTLICYESLRYAPMNFYGWVQTPVDRSPNAFLRNKYAIIPILRAGMGMLDGIFRVLPTAKVGHIGMYRDPETLDPHDYYHKFPTDIADREVILIDPMLATGGTADMSIQFLKKSGASNIKLLCLVSCDTGVNRLLDNHPDVKIYTAAHDSKLNNHGYIVPGLGDAGDRIYGTK